jgi:RNA polymerase sigma-70 factor (ECF subfamily)
MLTNGTHTSATRLGRARSAATALAALQHECHTMARVCAGDRAAFRELYDATNRTVVALLVRMLRSRSRAEEVLVDTYAQAWEQRERYDDSRGTPAAWLLTLARTRAIDRLRADARDRVVCQGDGNWVDALLAPDVETVTELERGEEAVRIDGALSALPPEQARLVRAAFFAGLSHNEIAALEGLPLGTVKSRIRAGLAHLRLLLAEPASPPASNPAAGNRPATEGTSR